MLNKLRFTFGLTIALMMFAAPLGYKRWHDREYRNFRVVEDGVLYRGGQYSLPRLQHIVSQYGIRTVISLRDTDQPTDKDEEIWVKARGLNFVRIPPRSWWQDASGNAPADESVATFREIMKDAKNHPVFVHCFAGIHRTGTMVAIFRMDFQGWSNVEAMNEMRRMGYTILDDHDDVRGYLIRYQSPSSTKNPLP